MIDKDPPHLSIATLGRAHTLMLFDSRRYIKRGVLGVLAFTGLFAGPFLIQEGGPLNWSWWPSVAAAVAAFVVRCAFHTVYPPVAACRCRATVAERRASAMRHMVSALVSTTGTVHSAFFLAILHLQLPDVHGPLADAWRDVRRGDGDRKTVCKVLELDPTRHPYALDAGQQKRVVSWRDSVATATTRGQPTVTTEPVLVRAWGARASGRYQGHLRLYHRGASDLDGISVLESMVVAERPCSTETPGLGT